MYSEKAMKNFENPQNAYRMLDADAESSVGEPWCGDSLRMYIKVNDNVIEDISYLAFGCGALIATSSMTSIIAKDKTLEEALKIREQDIVEALDGLPEVKRNCSSLAVNALKTAIQVYEDKRAKPKIQSMQWPY